MVGPKMAKKLAVDLKVKVLKNCERQDELLNDVQKGLRYYEDILKRIPRKEINIYDKLTKYFNMVSKVLKSNATIQIVGSWRRGAETSGDIDVIICDKKHDSKLKNLLIN